MPLFYKEKEILWADPSLFTPSFKGPVFSLYIFLKESVYITSLTDPARQERSLRRRMATFRRICSSVASSLPLRKGSETAKGVLKGLSLKTRVADPDPGSGAFLTETARSFKETLSQNQCFASGSGIRCLFDPWIRDPVPF
jgi:hypothetical protein